MSDVRQEILLGEIKKELQEIKEILRQMLETLRLQLPFVNPYAPYPYEVGDPWPPNYTISETGSADEG